MKKSRIKIDGFYRGKDKTKRARVVKIIGTAKALNANYQEDKVCVRWEHVPKYNSEYNNKQICLLTTFASWAKKEITKDEAYSLDFLNKCHICNKVLGSDPFQKHYIGSKTFWICRGDCMEKWINKHRFSDAELMQCRISKYRSYIIPFDDKILEESEDIKIVVEAEIWNVKEFVSTTLELFYDVNKDEIIVVDEKSEYANIVPLIENLDDLKTSIKEAL